MNENVKSIGIIPENYGFESNYLPLISFKTQQHKDIAERYILTKVEGFFKDIIKIDIDVEKSQIVYPKTISEKDFARIPVSYFYEHIVFDLGERVVNGKLKKFPKWGITFEKQSTPIEVSWLTSNFVPKYEKPKFRQFDHNYLGYKFNYRYGTIDVNGSPIFYYIYFDLQEILDEIRHCQIER